MIAGCHRLAAVLTRVFRVVKQCSPCCRFLSVWHNDRLQFVLLLSEWLVLQYNGLLACTNICWSIPQFCSFLRVWFHSYMERIVHGLPVPFWIVQTPSDWKTSAVHIVHVSRRIKSDGMGWISHLWAIFHPFTSLTLSGSSSLARRLRLGCTVRQHRSADSSILMTTKCIYLRLLPYLRYFHHSLKYKVRKPVHKQCCSQVLNKLLQLVLIARPANISWSDEGFVPL